MYRTLTFAVLFFALAQAATSAAPPERTSTVADRTLVNVTVYNGGIALIHDRRRVTLDEGLNRIAWRDVSGSMDATSALLQNLSPQNSVAVLEQNFDYDLVDPSALLQKYVGREVTIVHPARFAGERDTRETARVLSAGENGDVVLQYRDRIETGVRGYIVYPTAPGTFRDRPTLVLDVQSRQAGSDLLDLSYLTSGMSWRADYVGTLDRDERRLSLTGLVTISNTSGASYENARLQLVAGNVNIVEPPAPLVRAVSAADVYAVNPQVAQENYFEYHLYTFPRATDILDNQTKQLSLLAARDVPVVKTLELRGSRDYYEMANPDLGDRLPVGVYVSFENRGGGLGIPLPGGIVRIYQDDSRGISQFLGSDQIEHTPRNQTVRLHLGNSFDVTARKKQTDFQLASNCSADSSYQIVLANAKDTPAEVLVVEPIPGDWQILNESLPHVKSSASTASWKVRVAPGSSTTLAYTARVRWCAR